jgi:hypothetical protein
MTDRRVEWSWWTRECGAYVLHALANDVCSKPPRLRTVADLNKLDLSQMDRSWMINTCDQSAKADNTTNQRSDISRNHLQVNAGLSTQAPPTDIGNDDTKSKTNFSFAGLVGPNDEGDSVHGKISELSARVVASVETTMAEIARRHAAGTRPAHPARIEEGCAHLFSTDHTKDIRWTVDSPRKYACYSCFNARRACLLYVGNLKWLILPLPPKARGKLTFERSGYYLYPEINQAAMFPNTWEASKRNRKRKLPEW